MKTATTSDLDTSLGIPNGMASVQLNANGTADVTGPDNIPISVVLESELWRLRALCTRRGKDAAVMAGIAALTTNQRQVANARWNYCGLPIQRDEWLSKLLRVWMGYNNKQFDAFFTEAQAL